MNKWLLWLNASKLSFGIEKAQKALLSELRLFYLLIELIETLNGPSPVPMMFSTGTEKVAAK